MQQNALTKTHNIVTIQRKEQQLPDCITWRAPASKKTIKLPSGQLLHGLLDLLVTENCYSSFMIFMERRYRNLCLREKKNSKSFTVDLKIFTESRYETSYSGYQPHAPFNDFFPISKTKFWWTSIKYIHDNSRVHFVSVSRRCSIDVGSCTIA